MENRNSFWVTNITKKVVHLDDIGVIIYPYRSLNLLDKKHNSLTLEQLEASAATGTLYKKRYKVVIRKVPPGTEQMKYLPFNENAVYPTKHRSVVEVDNIKYDELDISDDSYAEENADTAQTDQLGKWKK